MSVHIEIYLRMVVLFLEFFFLQERLAEVAASQSFDDVLPSVFHLAVFLWAYIEFIRAVDTARD